MNNERKERERRHFEENMQENSANREELEKIILEQ